MQPHVHLTGGQKTHEAKWAKPSKHEWRCLRWWGGGGGGEAGVLQQQFDWWLQEEWTLVKDWCTVHYAFRASTGSLTMLTMLKTVFGGSVVDSSWTLLRWLTAVIRSVAEDEDNIQKTWRCGKLECLQRLPAAAAEEAHIAKMCSVLCIH